MWTVDLAVKEIVGKRLTYAEVTGKTVGNEMFWRHLGKPRQRRGKRKI